MMLIFLINYKRKFYIMKNLNPLYSFIKEDVDVEEFKNKPDAENIGIGVAKSAGVAGLYGGAAYGLSQLDAGPVAHSAVGGIALLTLLNGIGSLYLRSRIQKRLFVKIANRFPTAKDMFEFMKDQNIHPHGLSPTMNDKVYARWLQNVILKKRDLGEIFKNLFNTYTFRNAKDLYDVTKDTPDEIIMKRLGDKKYYDSMQRHV